MNFSIGVFIALLVCVPQLFSDAVGSKHAKGRGEPAAVRMLSEGLKVESADEQHHHSLRRVRKEIKFYQFSDFVTTSFLGNGYSEAIVQWAGQLVPVSTIYNVADMKLIDCHPSQHLFILVKNNSNAPNTLYR